VPAALLLLLLQVRWLMGPGSLPRPSICRYMARMIFWRCSTLVTCVNSAAPAMQEARLWGRHDMQAHMQTLRLTGELLHYQLRGGIAQRMKQCDCRLLLSVVPSVTGHLRHLLLLLLRLPLLLPHH
jgi:hypothetical protein